MAGKPNAYVTLGSDGTLTRSSVVTVVFDGGVKVEHPVPRRSRIGSSMMWDRINDALAVFGWVAAADAGFRATDDGQGRMWFEAEEAA